MRLVRDVLMMVSGAALFVYSLATASSSPLAYMLGMAMLCLPIVMHGDRRQERADVPAPVTRPDADVAQYLNDGDRAWLMEHGDWTDPTVRVVEGRVTAAQAALNAGVPPHVVERAAPTLSDADRKRRAAEVVSQMDSTDGWRTTRYADGRTVEHAVTDESSDMSEAKVKYLAGSSPARQQQTLNGDVLVVCPSGRYSGHDGPCRWFARVTDAQARRVRADHLQASPQCAKALSGRTHTPDGDPWPPGAPTDVTRRGAYASDAPGDDYERLARQMRRQAYIAHDVLGVERPT